MRILDSSSEGVFIPFNHFSLYAAGRGRKYAFCGDVFSDEEFPFSLELLRRKEVDPYITGSGRVVALRLKQKRSSGFLIPASTWGFRAPGQHLIETLDRLFGLFNLEAITPASLSEKVLRQTLPERNYISRPSMDLRRVLLDTPHGGRIDVAEDIQWYPALHEYDMNKAYLNFAKSVPSPYKSPVGLYRPSLDELLSYPASFALARLIAHNTSGIQPIQILDNLTGQMRKPKEGEEIYGWRWSREICDMVARGYTLDSLDYAYGFREMSGFMATWADTLYEKYQEVKGEPVADLLKTMMVGLPGRFLKRPETFTLIHISEAREGDVAILANSSRGKRATTDWLVRTEPDEECAQLTPVGSFIVMQCRQDMFERMKEEERRNNVVIASYIDSYIVTNKSELLIGANVGDFKASKQYEDVIVIENRVLGYDEAKKLIGRVPGFTKDIGKREELRKLYALRLQKGKEFDSS